MKKENTTPAWPVDPSLKCETTLSNIDLVAAQARIFKQEKSGDILVGGFPLKKEVRELLRDQAASLLRSELYDIFEATLTNEAARLALESGNFDHVQFAKALQYWNGTMKKIFTVLAK